MALLLSRPLRIGVVVAVVAVGLLMSLPTAQGARPRPGVYGAINSAVTIRIGETGLTAQNNIRPAVSGLAVSVRCGFGISLGTQYPLGAKYTPALRLPFGPHDGFVVRHRFTTYFDEDAGEEYDMRPVLMVLTVRWIRPNVATSKLRITGPSHPRPRTGETCRYHEDFTFRGRQGVPAAEHAAFAPDGTTYLIRTLNERPARVLETCVVGPRETGCRSLRRALLPPLTKVIDARLVDDRLRLLLEAKRPGPRRPGRLALSLAESEDGGRTVGPARPVALLDEGLRRYQWRRRQQVVDVVTLVRDRGTHIVYRSIALDERPGRQPPPVEVAVVSRAEEPLLARVGSLLAVGWGDRHYRNGPCVKFCAGPGYSVSGRIATSSDDGRSFHVLEPLPEFTTVTSLFATRDRLRAITSKGCCRDDRIITYALRLEGLRQLRAERGYAQDGNEDGGTEVVDDRGRIHRVFVRNLFGRPRYFSAWSDDGGVTYTRPALFATLDPRYVLPRYALDLFDETYPVQLLTPLPSRGALAIAGNKLYRLDGPGTMG